MFRIFRTFRKSYLFRAHAATSPSKSTLNISIGLGIDRLSKSSPDMIWCTSQSARTWPTIFRNLAMISVMIRIDCGSLWRMIFAHKQTIIRNRAGITIPAFFPLLSHLRLSVHSSAFMRCSHTSPGIFSSQFYHKTTEIYTRMICEAVEHRQNVIWVIDQNRRRLT